MGIDRQSLVKRHHPRLSQLDNLSPFTLGNGEFCFTADVTGLQSFPETYADGIPLCTMSNWGWHSFARPDELLGASLELTGYETYGRTVYYPTRKNGQEQLYDWLRTSPHRFHLGQLGFEISLCDGSRATVHDLKAIDQELELWTGLLCSRFCVEGVPVSVQTCCHPDRDAVAVRVDSRLLSEGPSGSRISFVLRFPYPSEDTSAADWSKPRNHTTRWARVSRLQTLVTRVIDGVRYYIVLRHPEETQVRQTDEHTLVLTPLNGSEAVELTCCFEQSFPRQEPPTWGKAAEASAEHWSRFWSDGGAIELAESSDPRAKELERRIVLSQYLTAIQCSGSLPPQETGLTCNSWYGKFHLEMHWWHAAHFALWNRAYMLERSLWWYQSMLPAAKALAAEQGYTGARWPKMVGPDGDQSPSPIAPLLIWQQPHPIFMAELCYRATHDPLLLQIYADIVFESAEFMVSFTHYDQSKGRYVLGPPVIPAQENHRPEVTVNPTFELQYWRFGLGVAQLWRERLGLQREPRWDDVISRLSRLPVHGGVYVAHENCPDTFESFNHDHPSMLGAFGVLPDHLPMPGALGVLPDCFSVPGVLGAPPGCSFAPGASRAWPDHPFVDHDTMRRTLQRTISEWRWDRTWGWDYPMCAMTAARLGEPALAIDLLMLDTVKNRYLNNGHVWQRPNLPLYLPANGGLLTAVAMMAAGWDGCDLLSGPDRREDPGGRDGLGGLDGLEGRDGLGGRDVRGGAHAPGGLSGRGGLDRLDGIDRRGGIDRLDGIDQRGGPSRQDDLSKQRSTDAPGFPNDGTWTVRCERILPYV